MWLEKDALSGVLYDVTSQWDVPLMVTRGYPSLSFLHGAAEQIAAQTRPVHLYYVGDWDPSGLDIRRDVVTKLRKMAPQATIVFTPLAVTKAQIDQYALLTRPTKVTDTRSRRFAGESVEVDALPPDALRALVRLAIEGHIDPHALAAIRTIEAAERDTLRHFIDHGPWRTA